MQSVATPHSFPYYPPAAEASAAPSTEQWEEMVPGRAWVANRMSDIPERCWGRGIAANCFDARYYRIVEETLRDGFRYRYAVLHDPGRGAWAVQPFFLVDQDLAMGLPASGRVALKRLRSLFPRFLRSTILMVGCAAGEGALDCDEPWALALLRATLEGYARKVRASLLLFKDFPSHHREALALLAETGYKRVPSMPGAELPLEDGDFETYMQRRLSRVYRKGLRRKFRECERLGGVTMEEASAEGIEALVEEVYPLYRQTFERSSYRFEELTPAYFCDMLRAMGERAHLFVWRYQGRTVAFSLCMVHDGVLCDMNVGLDYSVALHLHLYFITWRDIISWAMARGLKSYYTGPLNYDPKLHFRLRLAPLDLYVRHRNRWINPLFGKLLEFLHPTRYEAILRRFPNAGELW